MSDTTGDGRPELFSYASQPDRDDVGDAYVVEVDPEQWAVDALPSLVAALWSTSDEYGTSDWGVADTDGDGRSDIVLDVSPWGGRTIEVMRTPFDPALKGNEQGFVLRQDLALDGPTGGAFLERLGDIDGDGAEEVLAGGDGTDPVLVLHLWASGALKMSDVGWSVTSDEGWSGIQKGLMTAGQDVDADGVPDFAFWYQPRGQILVFSGARL